MSSQTRPEDTVVEVGKHQSTHLSDKRWRVNRKLLPLKMFYFFFYGASGSIIPFITVYLKYLRLSASEAGLITGLAMLLAMLLRAFIGMLADKMSAKKAALLVCCLGFGTAFFSLWFVPRRVLPAEPSVNSASDIFNYVAQQKQPQVYTWICFTDDGRELCSYPPNLGSYSCQIFEEHTLLNVSGHQYSDGTQVMSSEKYVIKYLNTQTNDLVNITEAAFSDHQSAVNDQERERIYLPTFVADTNFNKPTPCFYVDSSAKKYDTSGVDHYNLKNPIMAQTDNQILSYDVKHRHATDIYHTNLRSPGVASSTNGTVSCLLNCSRYLVSSFYDVDYKATFQPLNDSTISTRGTYQTVTPDLAFLLSFVLLLIGKSTYSASTSLIDAVAYTILGPYSLKWGQQRLWGTVGTGVVVLTITLISDRSRIENFAGIFIACLTLSFMTFLTGLLKLRADNTPKNKTFFRDMKKLVSTGSVRLFLCKLLFYGMMAGTSQNFIFWFLVDLGSGQITLGVCLLMYCVSSVILLRYSRLLLHKLGQIKVMYLTLIAYAIRFLVLSFLTNAWQVLPIEILHGVTYSLFWAAVSSTASIIAPAGTQATSQGLAGAMYWDLGRGIGIVVTGQFLHLFGSRWTFRAYSIICVGILPVLWVLDRIWSLQNFEAEKRDDNKEKDGDAGAQLLKSITMNGYQLNNNTDKRTVLDNEPDMELPATNDDSESLSASEREIYFNQTHTFAIDDIKHGDLVTSAIDDIKDSEDNTRVEKFNSRTHSTSNHSTSCNVCDVCTAHVDHSCPRETSSGTEAVSISSQLRPGTCTDVTENSNTHSIRQLSSKYIQEELVQQYNQNESNK